MCKNNTVKIDVNTVVNTPYDNAYRTLLDSCPRLIIPLINEIFGENYTGNERIEQSPNEFFIITEDNRKIVTDSVFTVTGERVGHYHIEYQSTPDGTILIRMFKYDSQIAVRYAAVQNEVKNQRLKTDLISNVSHDLKTPLTSMISYLDILEKEGLDCPDAPAHLAIVKEKTERLKTLTEELFEAAKASSGNIPCEIEDIDIAALIDQSLAEMGDRLAKKKLKIKKNINKYSI